MCGKASDCLSPGMSIQCFNLFLDYGVSCWQMNTNRRISSFFARESAAVMPGMSSSAGTQNSLTKFNHPSVSSNVMTGESKPVRVAWLSEQIYTCQLTYPLRKFSKALISQIERPLHVSPVHKRLRSWGSQQRCLLPCQEGSQSHQ